MSSKALGPPNRKTAGGSHAKNRRRFHYINPIRPARRFNQSHKTSPNDKSLPASLSAFNMVSAERIVRLTLAGFLKKLTFLEACSYKQEEEVFFGGLRFHV